MSEVKHTPGPWMTEAEYRDGSAYLIYAKGSKKIADLRSSGAEAPESDGEIDANAQLIAAAPELLAALEALLAAEEASKHDFTAKEIDGLEAAMSKAEAAIAKAKGGQA